MPVNECQTDIALFDQEKKNPHEYAALSFNDFNLFQIFRWGIMYMYVVVSLWGVYKNMMVLILWQIALG